MNNINQTIESVEIKEAPKKEVKKPDDLSGLNIEAKVKIFDPESDKVYFEGRA